MQWMIPFAGILILILLALSVRRTAHRPISRGASLEGALHAHFAAVAKQMESRGTARINKPAGLLAGIEKNVTFLNGLDMLLPAGQWLSENGRFLQEEALTAEEEWKQLPRLPRSAMGTPRLMVFVSELIAHTNADLTRERYEDAVSAWQSSSPFTHDEWNAIVPVIRLGLLEQIKALSDECARQHAEGLAAKQTAEYFHQKKKRKAMKLFQTHAGSPAYLEHLLGLVDCQKSEWLAAHFAEKDIRPNEIIEQVHAQNAELCLWIGNAINSLRTFSRLPWARFCEEWSLTHQALQHDSVYSEMDQESRAFYRSCVADIAKRARLSEKNVCAGVQALCRSAQPGTLEAHVGYYLFDQGTSALYAHLHANSWLTGLRRWFGKRFCIFFRACSWLSFALLCILGAYLNFRGLLLVPFAAVLLYGCQQFIMQLLLKHQKPRMVPRIKLDSLTEQTQTLVVFPTMLMSASHALQMVKHLSIAHEANPDAHLHFLLLGDFQDSLTGTLSTDTEILETAICAIDALCKDTGHPFYYIQRERAYIPGEQVYHSRERKRGGLETLLKLLEGRAIDDAFAYSSIEPHQLFGRYRYVITLDSDTILPPGEALRMIGAMLHPLNQRMKHNGKMRGVSVLQPRMETAAHTVKTTLGRWLGGTGGTDPYNALVSSFDMDMLRRGTFMGKGIIDPKPFLDATEKSILPGSILSHDLLEGELAGCSQTSDIVLYDGEPQTLKGYLYRLHRWTRGDWQLLPYVCPFFPRKYRPQNAGLAPVSKFKIWRNLFRSLIAPMRFILLFYALLTGRWFWFLLFALCCSTQLRDVPIRLAILPCEAVMQIDAIARTLYRLWFSRRNLLSWTTAAQTAQSGTHTPMLFFYANMISAGFMALIAFVLPHRLFAIPLAVLWAAVPFFLPFLEKETKSTQSITPYMRDVLVRLARSTLTFFETAIGPEDHALPPDNIQIEPNTGIAHRTSPTNIGLYLCSLVCAEKLRLISPDEMARRMDETISTLEKLQKWKGHFYNWYDTRTLNVLPPAFVSSVDCGNLAVCLLACAQAIRMLLPELSAAYHHLAEQMDEMVRNMDFTGLYDADAELFRIGFNVDADQPSAAHYDLLASESRLLSFAAIMLRQIPIKHWHRLGRPRVSLRTGQSLLSYSGTMFEYMMPLLFQETVPGTLLDTVCRNAVKAQQKHHLGGAFGVSESGYYGFDPQLQYQYKAFGLPSLALSAETTAQVLAPYASMLCLPLSAKSAFRNLQRLVSLGLQGPLGLFEAADFDKGRTDGQTMHIIRSHMAHHQGMVLCAICNTLEDNYLAKLFSSLPRAEAYRLLLEEKNVPARRTIRKPLRRPMLSDGFSPFAMERDALPLRFPVDAHLLHGKDTTLLIDAQGNGFISRSGVMLTRFQESCTLPSGPRFFLRDSQSGAYWDATDPRIVRRVRFETAQAIYEHRRFDVECILRIWVNPLDGAVLHSLELTNHSSMERMMEIASYMEPVLAPQRDAQAHPAFQNLFIQTERFAKQGVCAVRRPRNPDESTHRIWHTLSSNVEFDVMRIQTDRTAFHGRCRHVRTPRALSYPISAVADMLGDVIEPCLSLRGQFRLPAKGRASLLFATHMPSETENAEAFCQRYEYVESALRTYDTALTKALVTARFYGLDAEKQKLISRIPGALVYSGQPHQAVYATGNSLPVQELWSLGISGDLPILLIECEKNGSLDEAQLLMNAHAFWFACGLWVDLVLTTFQTEDTIQLEDQRRDNSHVYVLENAEASKLSLLRACARLVLNTSQPLETQLDVLQKDLRIRPLYMCRSNAGTKEALPPAPPLLLENGYGGFTQPDGNYQITLDPGRQTPAPWCNPLCNPEFGTLASECGPVFTYARNSHSGRLTRWTNDSLSPAGDEGFFLRDKSERLLWSVTRMPLGQTLPVRITHAPGETIYESSGYGIYTKLHCFTDSEWPLGLRVVQIRNDGMQKRDLLFVHSVQFTIGTQPTEASLTSLTCAQERIWVRNPCMDGAACLAAIDPRRCAVKTLAAGLFHGLTVQALFALSALEQLPQTEGTTGVLSFQITLEPGECCSITTAILYGQTREEISDRIEWCRSEGASKRLHLVRQLWEERLGVIRFDLPDQAMALMLGRWLPYQVQASRLWMRAGFYQAGGAYGFRDQLQDVLSLLHIHPEDARKHILMCAAHQFEEGDVQHWWHPLRNGIRTRISDDKLFLPYVASVYCNVTDDKTIWDESIPYLHAAVLEPGEKDRYFTPEISDTVETLREHCVRAIQSVTYGVHGIPLMQGGDWNDGMDLVGGENGESVWLGMFLCEVLRSFAPYCPKDHQDAFAEQRKKLLTSLERYAWDGAWYLRGWYSNGKPLGSHECSECKIDLLPQAWSVLCGLPAERSVVAMEHAWQMLYERDTNILRLFTPPFNGDEQPGYIAGYMPGIRENGGQYTHAACWALAALHELKYFPQAWELAKALLPVTHSTTRQLAARYRTEPYAMAADIYSNPQQRGRGGWTWYTGSAGWYLNVMLTYLLGFQKKGNFLHFHPTAPESWEQFTITYQYGSATYHLHASRSCKEAHLDGAALKTNGIPLEDDGRIHDVTFPLT